MHTKVLCRPGYEPTVQLRNQPARGGAVRVSIKAISILYHYGLHVL